jgi:TonB-linked SusC/RagA family outer membrane protein
MLLGIFSVSAEGYAQRTTISMNIQNGNIYDIVSEIEKQTEFMFFYKSSDIDNNWRVTVQAKNQTVSEILNEVTKGTDLAYSVNNKVILLAKKTDLIARQIRITGTVVDEKGEPLTGANVVEKGTTNGIITDMNGHFSLEISTDAILSISYIGYAGQEVTINNQTHIVITLKEDLQNLEEVIVIGYGIQKKSDITGALIRVDEKSLTSRPVSNALEGMQGKAAGVDISSSERPGTVGSITIRGVRSLTASNSPLYVVDGIPLMSGGIEYINPNDIEAIDVLKDASATAIYGSRGANGVVIVTTKQGKAGKFTLNYSGSLTTDNLHDRTTMMDASEYIDFRRWAYYYSNPTVFPKGDQPTQENDYRIFLGGGDPYAWENIMKGWASGSWDGSKVPSTNWVDMVTQTGITNDHTLSVSGGTEKMKGYASFGYLDTKGTSKGQEYTRYTGRATLEVTPVKWFSMGANINASYSIQEYGQANVGASTPAAPGSIYASARGNLAYAVPFDHDGNRILFPGADEGIKTVIDEWKYSQDQRVTFRTFGSFFAQLDFGNMFHPLEGLKYRMNFGPDFSLYRDGVYIDGYSIIRNGTSYAALDKNQSLSYTLDNLVYYDKNIGKHGIGVTLLQTQTKYTYEASGMSADDVPLPSQKWNAITTSNVPSLKSWTSGISERQLMSYMGRLNYNFADRYLLTVSGRWDGASQLADNHKWSFFPSAAVGWRLDQEQFMENTSWIRQLKARLGVGVTGNSAISPYLTKGAVGSLFYPFGQELKPGSIPNTSLANQTLGWEKTTQYNLGVDFSLWKGRVSGVVDVYTSQTKDLLMRMNLPSVSGYTNTYANIGETANKGIDITVSTVNLDFKDFRWSTDLNASWQKDHIVSLANGKEDDLNNNWFIGQPQSVIYAYEPAGSGVWRESDLEEMEKFNANGSNFQIGGARPADRNGDYKIDANNDRVIIGHTRPRWIVGMTNTFEYKGFELSIFLYGRLKYTTNRGGEIQTGRNNQRKISYYTENNKNAEYQKPIYSAGGTGDPYYTVLGYFDGSFIKIRNISIGYHVPKKVVKNLNISNLRLYTQVTNPGMLYTNVDWYDMDVSDSIFNRRFTFGINVGF